MAKEKAKERKGENKEKIREGKMKRKNDLLNKIRDK